MAALLKKLLPKTLYELPSYENKGPEKPTWSNTNAVYEQGRRQLATWAVK